MVETVLSRRYHDFMSQDLCEEQIREGARRVGAKPIVTADLTFIKTRRCKFCSLNQV